MNIESLSEFAYLADTLSFRRTAEHFYVSRSVISRHLAALEDALGAVLLERNAHGVELTQAGKVFLSEAQAILRAWNLAQQRVRAASAVGNTLVRVGYLRNGARPFLAKFVKAMACKHPDVHLSLSCMGYQQARIAMEEHSIDVMLGINVDPSLTKNYRSTLIYKDYFVAACGRSHPLAGRTDGVTFDDLREQRLVVPDSYVSAGLAKLVGQLVDERALSESGELYQDIDMLNLKIQTEDVIAFVSSLNTLIFEESLAILPIVGIDTGFSISAYYHDGFDGAAYEACKAEFEACQRLLAATTLKGPWGGLE
jgi:DNA-binding transcriptional LysR family regulator